MSQNTLFTIILIGVFLLWILKRNSSSVGLKISLSDAKKRLETEKNIALVDVRTRDEYTQKHIPNSTLIPLDVLAKEAHKKLPDKNAEIFVYCASGSRSSAAVKTLIKLGYTRVYNLGGIVRWPYETVSGNK